jgi:hypothetical protein
LNKPDLLKCLKALPLLLVAGCLHASETDLAVPFDAVYQVYVDGKPRMETQISLARKDGHWLMSSDGKGTKGLPKMLKFRNHERSEGEFVDGYFQPHSFRHQTKVVGKDDSWSALYNKQANTVTTQHEEGSSSLQPAKGTVDPLSLTLAQRYHLKLGETGFHINLIDETEVDEHEYQAGTSENLETSLGCFKVVPLTRIKKNSTRYSQGWYAPSLAFVPLKLLHGKQGGKEFEMKITSLLIDGKEVLESSDC